jgi:hypothetical protein
MMSRARMHATLAQNAQDLSPWLLVAAAAFVALVALLVVSPFMRKHANAAEPTRATRVTQRAVTTPPPATATIPATPATPDSAAVERDLRELMRELSEMTRRSTAQFDARAARLEQLIRAADERLAKLTGAMTPAGEVTADAPQTTLTPLAAEPAPASAPASTPLEPDGSGDVVDPRHVEIYTLCEQGLSIPQIADRLRRPSGEIELIIALRPRRRAAVTDT